MKDKKKRTKLGDQGSKNDMGGHTDIDGNRVRSITEQANTMRERNAEAKRSKRKPKAKRSRIKDSDF